MGSMDWADLTDNTDKWRALMNTVINPPVPSASQEVLCCVELVVVVVVVVLVFHLLLGLSQVVSSLQVS